MVDCCVLWNLQKRTKQWLPEKVPNDAASNVLFGLHDVYENLKFDTSKWNQMKKLAHVWIPFWFLVAKLRSWQLLSSLAANLGAILYLDHYARDFTPDVMAEDFGISLRDFMDIAYRTLKSKVLLLQEPANKQFALLDILRPTRPHKRSNEEHLGSQRPLCGTPCLSRCIDIRFNGGSGGIQICRASRCAYDYQETHRRDTFKQYVSIWVYWKGICKSLCRFRRFASTEFLHSCQRGGRFYHEEAMGSFCAADAALWLCPSNSGNDPCTQGMPSGRSISSFSTRKRIRVV